MPIAARTIGGPGGGKTKTLLDKLALCLERKVCTPLSVGYVSFTRAGRHEAAMRAADQYDLSVTELEKSGYFRTLHSIAYRHIGVAEGELILGGEEDTEWLRSALNDPYVCLTRAETNDDQFAVRNVFNESSLALAIWEVSRNRLCPLEDVWRRVWDTNERVPDLGVVQDVVGLYEHAKRQDGRLDFSDLLFRFAGYRWTGCHESPFEEVDPDGEVPLLPVWFLDEAQDISRLMAAVFRRLVTPATFVYLGGDQLQAIFSWAGADERIFVDWPVAKEEELPISYRCGQKILDYSYRFVHASPLVKRRRDFSASRPGGEVTRDSLEGAIAGIEPGEDVLVLARTNEYVRDVIRLLEDRMVPWRPLKGLGGFAAPARAAGIMALVQLKNGERVDGPAIHRLLELIPSKSGGTTLLQRGTKEWFKDKEHQESLLPCALSTAEDWGATEALCGLIASGEYKALLDAKALKMARTAEARGIKALANPSCLVGTAHSSKGMQADHVIAVDRIPYPVQRAIEDPAGIEEERRLWYVTATRARHKLTIAEADGEPFPEL